MKNETDMTEYHAARERGEKEHKSVDRVQTEDRLARLSEQLNTPASRKLAAAREKLELELHSIEQKQAEEMQAVAQWESLLNQWDTLEKELASADQQAQAIQETIEGARESLENSGQYWGAVSRISPPITSLPNGLAAQYGYIYSLELALKDFPRWRKTRSTKQEALKTEIAQFAKAHGIADERHLPFPLGE